MTTFATLQTKHEQLLARQDNLPEGDLRRRAPAAMELLEGARRYTVEAVAQSDQVADPRERDLLRAYYEERFGQGFRYASVVPGLTKVVQAAGRLVRRPDDRGVVVLVGRRFRWRDHAALLPAAWSPEIAQDPAASVARFWEGTP